MTGLFKFICWLSMRVQLDPHRISSCPSLATIFELAGDPNRLSAIVSNSFDGIAV